MCHKSTTYTCFSQLISFEIDPNNNWSQKKFIRTEIHEQIPPPIHPQVRALPDLVPIFALACGVNALAGVLFLFNTL